MKRNELYLKLSKLDSRGRRIFNLEDLGKIMGISSKHVLDSTLYRETRMSSPVLTRVAHGVYMNNLTRNPKTNIIEEIARVLRRGSHNYVSFESALSEHGRISQIPQDYVSVATTGNSGRFQTAFGMIEFTKVRRTPVEIAKAAVDVGRPLPIAKVDVALEDLQVIGRNLHLVLPEEQPELGGLFG